METKNKDLGHIINEIIDLRSALLKKFDSDMLNEMYELEAKKNGIMKQQFLDMETVYFAHAMKTYFPEHCCYEKRAFDIWNRELNEGGKLRTIFGEDKADKLKNAIINPNSEEYRWKGSIDFDMHSQEEWGFSWRKFSVSMPHYCDLVTKSDGLIWGTIFTHNNRKNAKSKYIRKVPRGMKTEISCATKLGIPTLTFTKAETVIINGTEYILPTDINIPNYMIEHIDAKIDWGCGSEWVDSEGNGGEIVNDNGTVLGYIIGKGESGNTVLDHNGNTFSELFSNDDFYIDKQIASYIHIKGMNGLIKEDSIEGLATLGGKILYKNWEDYSSNRESKNRYSSPNPFDMYYDTNTGEIHENPTKYGNWVVFEPWDKEFMKKFL
jgi:hypothetical protein